MYIILCRHPKSYKNKGEDRPVDVRNYDIPIVEGYGHAQAEELGEQLGNWLNAHEMGTKDVRLVNSPYERARRGLECMAIGSQSTPFDLGACDHRESMQIAEMDEGPTQDLPEKDASHPEIIKKYTAFFNEREKKKAAGKDYFKVPYPWGEGRKEVKERCKDFLKDEISKANHDGIKALVIVSHASICHALQAYACGHDKTWFNDHTPLTYGGITILEGDKLKEFKELPAEELKAAFPGHHIRGHYKKDNFPIGR